MTALSTTSWILRAALLATSLVAQSRAAQEEDLAQDLSSERDSDGGAARPPTTSTPDTARKPDRKSTSPPRAEPLPPPPIDELRVKAPQPSFDAALLLAACGIGQERAWERTRFCLGGLADVIAGRQKESDPGAGGYLQVATAGFRDVRASVGFSGIVSLIDWFTLSARVGGLVRAGQGGVAPGAEGFLELGHRSVSLKSRYGMSHALLGGLGWVAPVSGESAETTIWVGLRIDGIWLTAPRFLF